MPKIRRSLRPCFRFFALLIAALPALSSRSAQAEPVQAASAASFLDSIGVCAHWGYTDTPYGFAYDGVKQKLLASGIRHVRDGMTRPLEQQRIEELGKLGIHFCVLAEPELGTPEQIKEKVKAVNARVPGAIDAIEGPNEPDLFWVSSKKTYKGKSGANGSREAVEAASLFLQDTGTAFKSDPATAGLTVIGIALGKTYDPGGGNPNPLAKGSLTSFVDWGNFHPYFGGNPFSVPFRYGTIEKYFWQGTNPGTNINDFPFALTTYAPPYAPKPMAATEAGCATDTNGTSEIAHGKYIPRMFCEYFRKGIRRTYSYEFVDEFTDANNREARFGLLHRDLSPKPAYTALKNIIAALRDTSAEGGFKPGRLDFAMSVMPAGEWNRTQDVHSLLLQKSTGDFYLLLWHEVANEDGSVKPRRQIQPPPMPTTITVSTKVYPQARVYRLDEQGQITEEQKPLTKGVLQIDVPDRVTIVKFSPVKR